VTGALKTLLFSTLFPSSIRAGHGIFVETRLRELMKTGEVECKVVAPVPWFPSAGSRFGQYANFSATPRFEHRNGCDVFHPRYFLPPKVGMNIAPHTLAMGSLPAIRRLIADGFDFDLIDAHYYYPDGVAAGIIARKLGKPFVVTARGTDINLISDFSYPRKLIVDTAAGASASIGVSSSLVARLAALGADPKKLRVFRNGVDLDRFQPESQPEARTRIGLPATAKILLSVGNLIELKGHHIGIKALRQMSVETYLVIAGTGSECEKLQDQARQLGLAERVIFAGHIDNRDLKWWYSAADALILCSSREGWANVLLEAMACGTPVIATPVGGTPEVISNDTAGQLMSERTPEALIDAYAKLISDYPDRQAVRRYAEQFSWQETSARQIALFREICDA
jgi:teichuronic acid biosynthesis glycosyltransferase TuaC